MNSDLKFVLLSAVGAIVGLIVLQHLQNGMRNGNKHSSTTTTTGGATVS